MPKKRVACQCSTRVSSCDISGIFIPWVKEDPDCQHTFNSSHCDYGVTRLSAVPTLAWPGRRLADAVPAAYRTLAASQAVRCKESVRLFTVCHTSWCNFSVQAWHPTAQGSQAPLGDFDQLVEGPGPNPPAAPQGASWGGQVLSGGRTG
jgi:hypothetical protein